MRVLRNNLKRAETTFIYQLDGERHVTSIKTYVGEGMDSLCLEEGRYN